MKVSEMMGGGYWGGLFTNGRLGQCRYRVYYGARNTKKSEDIMGREPLLKIMMNDQRNILMLRQNDIDNAQSTYANLVAIIGRLGLDGFKCYTSPHMIVYQPTGQKIVFRGFNNPTSLASIKFEHGYLTDIYIEEASEIESYEDFRVLDGSLRGVMPEGLQMQITLCMNPWNKQHWVYDVFVKGRMEDDYDYLMSHDYRECYDPEFTLGYGRGLYLHQSTYRVNEFRDRTLDSDKEELRLRAPEIYKTECLGMWGNSTALVYPEWNPEQLVVAQQECVKMKFCEYAIGIDTGYSDGQGSVRRDGSIKSATTAVLVGLTEDCSKFVALKEWYWTNIGKQKEKTVPELMADCCHAIEDWRRFYESDYVMMKGRIPVYIDCADKGFRQNMELSSTSYGLYGADFIGSTKIPIQTRVDFIRLLMGWGDFLVCDQCRNLIRELTNARRGDRGAARQDIDDHATNACEYAWTPMRERMIMWRTFKSRV